MLIIGEEISAEKQIKRLKRKLYFAKVELRYAISLYKLHDERIEDLQNMQLDFIKLVENLTND